MQTIKRRNFTYQKEMINNIKTQQFAAHGNCDKHHNNDMSNESVSRLSWYRLYQIIESLFKSSIHNLSLAKNKNKRHSSCTFSKYHKEEE